MGTKLNSNRRVVVTGLGTVNPIGFGVEEYWDNLTAGKSGGRKLSNITMEDYSVQIAAEVDLPDLTPYFTKKKMIRRLDRFILMGHVAGYQAVKDSGLDISAEPDRVGALIATGDAGLATHSEQIPRMFQRGWNHVTPFYITSVIPNSASAFLAMEMGMMGPSFSVVSACASSNHALGTAYNMIQSGMSDVIYTGGSEAVIVESSIAAFGNIGALSERNDSPETASRPFDLDRDGFVMGEGASVLCLEELEHAKKRGAKIYGELTGFGFTTDAYDLVAPHPEGIGAAKAIKNALNMAELNPEDIDFINCHGTSTPLGDKAECLAINNAFGKDLAEKIPSHSTKSMIGHLIGGASATEAVAGLMSFERGVIHHTINQFNKDPEINLNVITEPWEKKDVKHFLSDSFGFGGHNACVIFSKFEN